jgi:molecular chaperone GrpE
MESTDQAAPDQAAAGAAGEDPARRIAELEAQLQGAREDTLRVIAEMDNQRKRLAREVEGVRKFGAEKLLADLVAVRDSLEAGLAATVADAGKLREGMELTLRQLLKVLDGSGLSVIDPLGQPFDADAHQAMSMVDSDQHPPGTVVTVFQKGYRLHERLLRPALVAVARER